MAAAAALEQVSVPEERIGVEISDNESVVQRLDAGRRVIRRRVQELIVPGFDDGWDFKPRDHGKNEQDEDGAAKRLHGGKRNISGVLDGRGAMPLNTLPWAKSSLSTVPISY